MGLMQADVSLAMLRFGRFIQILARQNYTKVSTQIVLAKDYLPVCFSWTVILMLSGEDAGNLPRSLSRLL